MSLVVAFDDIKPEKKLRKGPPGMGLLTMPFFRATVDAPDTPTAFLARHDAGRVDDAHFHIVDQFQIIVEGKGKFGRHAVSPYCVHFSRAFTPYGPLLMDKKEGLAFIALRAHYDPGGQHHAQDKLRQMPERQPWQLTRKVTFPKQNSTVSLQPIPDMNDDQGLYAYTLTMPPHAHLTTPSATLGDGQFVVVLKGSLLHNHKEHRAPAIAHVAPAEGSFEIASGADGLEGLILNLPQVKQRVTLKATPSAAAGYKKWQCELCAFAYDEALGLPEDGIPPGTRWADVPQAWSCPDCAASKSDFQMVEI